MAVVKRKRTTSGSVLANQRRYEVAAYYLDRKTQSEIAEHLGITQQAVSKHLVSIQKEWAESAKADINKAKAEQLAVIDRTERKFCEGWERSLSDGRDGNPKFLVGILQCVSKRCDILGLDAPTKVESETLTNGEGLVGLLREAKRVVAEQGFSLYEIPERDERSH